jgi:uncharacterized protein YggT (Ycf19 family)
MRPYSFLSFFINLVVSAVEILLGLRLILRFFGANQSTPFVQWVYTTSEPILGPFRGIFPSPVIEGQYVLEFATVFAMLIYGLIGYFLVYLVSLVPTPEIEEHETTEVEPRRVRRRRL